jgi:hypothetical protein
VDRYPGTIHKGLEELLYVHFLHWPEVLSLIKVVQTAPRLLIIAAKWIGVNSMFYLRFHRLLHLVYKVLDKTLSIFAMDGIRFCHNVSGANISKRPPHLLICAAVVTEKIGHPIDVPATFRTNIGSHQRRDDPLDRNTSFSTPPSAGYISRVLPGWQTHRVGLCGQDDLRLGC